MPRYDYKCQPCDTTFEVTRSVTDRNTVTCPTCGTEAKRVFSPVGVVFKGSGFHNTDYRTERRDGGATPDVKPTPTAAPQCTESSCGSCPAASED